MPLHTLMSAFLLFTFCLVTLYLINCYLIMYHQSAPELNYPLFLPILFDLYLLFAKMQNNGNAYKEFYLENLLDYPSINMGKGLVQPVLTCNVSSSFSSLQTLFQYRFGQASFPPLMFALLFTSDWMFATTTSFKLQL